ncbi:mannonate dehydratase [Paenibacillus sp. P25]|nr:mannonate dehydratase [Paenibacillus sp. P25]
MRRFSAAGISQGESLGLTKEKREAPTYEELEAWWQQFLAVYSKLVPVAEEYHTKLSMHPSDTPNADTPFGGLGFHRIIDAFPSKQVGYIYCVGTRAEAGGSRLVLDEIHQYGRKGRIHLVHMRNVRGSLPTSGGFEEALLDDGDLNMFRVLIELRKINFDGCINPDHIPFLEGDDRERHSGDRRTACGIGLAYSIGYLKALLCALYSV